MVIAPGIPLDDRYYTSLTVQAKIYYSLPTTEYLYGPTRDDNRRDHLSQIRTPKLVHDHRLGDFPCRCHCGSFFLYLEIVSRQRRPLLGHNRVGD
jgi:hypothetical protein